MILTVYDPKNLGKQALYRFLLQLLVGNQMPVLVLGERSFSFMHFLRLGRMHKIPFSVTGGLLSVSAVNMYHVEEIVSDVFEKITSEIPGAFPVFMNFSSLYIDENVARETADFLFRRDLARIQQESRKTDRPALFLESGKTLTATRQTDYRTILYHTSSICHEFGGSNNKQNLTLEERDKLYGSSDSGIFHLCGEFIKRVEKVPQGSEKRGSGVLRRVLPGSIAEHPGRQFDGKSISNGNGTSHRDYPSSQEQPQPERRGGILA